MREHKTAYYAQLRKVGKSSTWLDAVCYGGARTRGLFLRPENITLTFITQLAFSAGLSLEQCIEVLWQHNIVDSPYFSNTLFKSAIPVVAPPSVVTMTKTVLRPYSKWWPVHLRGSKIAVLVWERKYRACDLDKFMAFPDGGCWHWFRKPYTISRIPDFIRLAAFMGITFNECLDMFLLIKSEPINIPLVLPVKKNRAKNNTLGSFTTFDMLRSLGEL